MRSEVADRASRRAIPSFSARNVIERLTGLVATYPVERLRTMRPHDARARTRVSVSKFNKPGTHYYTFVWDHHRAASLDQFTVYPDLRKVVFSSCNDFV